MREMQTDERVHGPSPATSPARLQGAVLAALEDQRETAAKGGGGGGSEASREEDKSPFALWFLVRITFSFSLT